MQLDLLLLTMLQHIIGYIINLSYFHNVQIEPKIAQALKRLSTAWTHIQ